MAFLDLPRAPGCPALSPARVHYREWGAGPPVLALHGGWGYEAYPFDGAARGLQDRFRVLAPDRVGYGGSGRVPALPDGFHVLMAEETILFMDALGIAAAALWGHSDGAVVAAWTAILHPRRVRALVLEALHHTPAKESSVEFFRTAVEAPERFGEEVVRALERDHGASWREVVGAGGRAWLRLIEEGGRGRADLYDGRLAEVTAPTLVLHGRRDPRTEPGEIEAALCALPRARLAMVSAGHCPHASSRAAAEVTALVAAFLDETAAPRP